MAGLAIGIGVDANLSDEIENLKDSVSKGFHAWQGNFEIIGSAFEQAFNREATETEEGTDGIEDQNE
ncbi:MAG TPA: hypothetical protein PLC52_01260 [Anaerolineales bacterium]|nr:hypothetical protein [Anaerolineales bacterium]HRQ91480.1 hypothetical protein [Anaerolineales bacterium]